MNIKPLTSWFEDGGILVDTTLAEKRGEICANCPLNQAELWWEKFSKDPIAATIKKWLEIKNNMQLRVSSEKKLFMCSACGCCTRLKIWEPLKYIVTHTDSETMGKYDPNCWILTEQN